MPTLQQCIDRYHARQTVSLTPRGRAVVSLFRYLEAPPYEAQPHLHRFQNALDACSDEDRAYVLETLDAERRERQRAQTA